MIIKDRTAKEIRVKQCFSVKETLFKQLYVCDEDKVKNIFNNEILCFLIEKNYYIPLDNLVRIATDFYSWDEICVAKCKLFESDLVVRIRKRKGQGRDVVSGFGWGGGGKIKIIVTEGAEGVGVWGKGIPSPKKIFADLSLKEAILKHFKMIISLLCCNTIVNIINVLKTNFLKLCTEH